MTLVSDVRFDITIKCKFNTDVIIKMPFKTSQISTLQPEFLTDTIFKVNGAIF